MITTRLFLLLLYKSRVVLRWPSLDLVAEADHARLVLLNEGLAVGGGVLGGGEEHTFVALGFFLFADAAGLLICVSRKR